MADFGFLFDIGPGVSFLIRSIPCTLANAAVQGIKFEPNSFKLTHEMITLMGGKTSQGYRQFCELTVKAFLSCRAYVEAVVSTCQLMMPTDLPSFKGEGTMVRLRERFRPELTEREAAKYMQGVIDNACENSMSIVYDQFQVRDPSKQQPAADTDLRFCAVLPKQDPLCFIDATDVLCLDCLDNTRSKLPIGLAFCNSKWAMPCKRTLLSKRFEQGNAVLTWLTGMTKSSAFDRQSLEPVVEVWLVADLRC